MQMFKSVLSRIPKNRSELVNDFEIPDIRLSPYYWDAPEEHIFDTDSSLTDTDLGDDLFTRRRGSLSTDSSPPLSRAMTDSEIDYDRYKRIQSRRLSDPWWQLREAMDLFPPSYVQYLNGFRSAVSDYSTSPSVYTPPYISTYRLERQQHFEELCKRAEKFLDEECRFFSAGDPGLVAIEEALQSIDMDILNRELENDFIGFK